ncbi:MAG: FeoB-associated Cys-rich membrane protein [Clostridiales bacterium]|nr:FeoB-associated Cys-rich membrane protein [Clostridiales bacterium]
MLTIVIIAVFAIVIFLALRSMLNASMKDGDTTSGCTGSCTTCSAHCRDILKYKESLKDRPQA